MRAAGTWVRHPPAAAAWQRFGRGCGRVSPKQLTALVVRTGFRLCVSCVHLLVTRVGGCLPSFPPFPFPFYGWACCCSSERTLGHFLCRPLPFGMRGRRWCAVLAAPCQERVCVLVGGGSARPLVLLAPPRRFPRGCVAAPSGGGVRGLCSPLGRPCTLVLGRPMRPPRGVRAFLPARLGLLPSVRPLLGGSWVVFWVGGVFLLPLVVGPGPAGAPFCSRGRLGSGCFLAVLVRLGGGCGCGGTLRLLAGSCPPSSRSPPLRCGRASWGAGWVGLGSFSCAPLGAAAVFRFACPALAEVARKILKNIVFCMFSERKERGGPHSSCDEQA